MTHRILLFSTDDTINQPRWWSNYVDSLKDTTIEPVNEDLKRYNAVVWIDKENDYARYLEFESEEHYSMFILRWS